LTVPVVAARVAAAGGERGEGGGSEGGEGGEGEGEGTGRAAAHYSADSSFF